MKAYTNINQSKKLAEILPVEGADMFIADVFLNEEQTHSYNFHVLSTWRHKNFDELKERENKFVQFIPCWSLAALLNVLPKFYNRYKSEFRLKLVRNEDDKWCCCYEAKYYTVQCDNPLDACYEIILWLNEQKLL